jgi:hypothetical protein
MWPPTSLSYARTVIEWSIEPPTLLMLKGFALSSRSETEAQRSQAEAGSAGFIELS